MAKPAAKAPGAGIMCALYSLSRARRNGAQDSSLAETEISALKSFETGQPVSAFFTAVSNFALSAPGILATRSRWLRSEEHTSELQSQSNLVCRLLLEKKNITRMIHSILPS